MLIPKDQEKYNNTEITPQHLTPAVFNFDLINLINSHSRGILMSRLT